MGTLDGMSAAERTVEILQDLLRIDTSNFGGGRAVGETVAAEYVVDFLSRLGLATEVVVHAAEGEPDRPSVFARLEGEDPSLPPLLVHGHLDVVPASAQEWSVDPFAGSIRDGCVWGRGAVDMKDMDAMVLATLEDAVGRGIRPRRTLVIAFFADEEAGGERGSHHVVTVRPDLFDGVEQAISEVGGYSVRLGDRRAYMVQTGEKGLMWMRLTAAGRAGHGSHVNEENAITRLAEALVRIGAASWPVELTPTTRLLLAEVARLTGVSKDEGATALGDRTGFAARFVNASLRTTVNPTVLEAGVKHNVVPKTATALIDVRPLPGQNADVAETIRRLAGPEVVVSVDVDDIGFETTFDGDLIQAIDGVIARHDPGALCVPYLLSAGTDNKALQRLGIRGFGFVPLRVPDDFDFPGMFHGVDERVPIESLQFGQRVLAELLLTY